MGTDVSDFSKKYSRQAAAESVASSLVLPQSITLEFKSLRNCPQGEAVEEVYSFERVSFPIRYGTNPHQSCRLYKPEGKSTSLGDMKVHKIGKEGFSLTNLQDISHAISTLKYFTAPAVIIMKHLVPCGFAVAADQEVREIYQSALDGDPRSAFGGTVGFNTIVDEAVAESMMKLFFENIVASGYTPKALDILRKNEGTKKMNHMIKLVEIPNMQALPKFWGDDISKYLTLRSLPTGELAIEIPYLSGVRSVDDLIIDPEVSGVEICRKPTENEVRDALTAWYIAINTRSNAVTIVKSGKAIAIGTGQQDRVGAVEQAIEKAKRYNPNLLGGAVLASDAFFPNRDSIDAAASAGISAVIWPAGSRADKIIIEAMNEHRMAGIVPKTGERCFSHF